MPTIKPRIQLTVDETLYENIEDIRYRLGFKSKSEAVCYLMEKGLEEELKNLPGENKRRIDEISAQNERYEREMEKMKAEWTAMSAQIKENQRQIKLLTLKDLRDDFEGISEDDIIIARSEKKGGKNGK